LFLGLGFPGAAEQGKKPCCEAGGELHHKEKLTNCIILFAVPMKMIRGGESKLDFAGGSAAATATS
jgi:hypothetical protein